MVADTLKAAHDSMLVRQGEQKRHYDLRRRAREPVMKPGDQIRIRNIGGPPGASRKLIPPWSPIHLLVRWLGRRHVECVDPKTGQTRRTHVRYLKPVVDRFVG